MFSLKQTAKVITLCLPSLLLAFSTSVSAQVASALASLQVVDISGGVASFAGALPAATPPVSNGRVVSLSFSPASLSGQTQWQGTGNVRSVTATQNSGIVTLRIALNSPAPVAINSSAGKYYIVVGVGAEPRRPVPEQTMTPRAERIPSPAPTSVGKPELILLKYADISEVAAMLSTTQVAPNDSFQAQQISFSSGLSGASNMGPSSIPVQSAPQGQGSTMAGAQRLTDTLFVDRRLNAIVATGSSEETQRVRALIATVDVPLPVILVQSEVVELTESAARDVGIAYGANGYLASGTLHAQTLQTAQSEASLQAAIFAAVQRGQGRIVSRPSVAAQSGTYASLLTGDSIPVLTTITYPGTTPVIEQQVQYISVGVSLQIQPRLNEDGFILCHILSQVSAVTQYVQGYPQVSQRTAMTNATVRSGEPLIIGGLVQESDLSTITKVPGLGDLPLIGGLFRVRHSSLVKTNLYIVTTMIPIANHARE